MKLDVNRPAYVIVFAGVVSALFTAAIMTLHAASEPAIRRNERLARERAVVEVFGLGDPARMEDALVSAAVGRFVRERTINPGTDEEMDILVAYRSERAARAADPSDRRAVRGYAFQFSGIGFWARITGLMAVSPRLDRVLGVSILSHSETPGLGGRITERRWREAFEGLDITRPGAGGRYIYVGGEESPDPSGARFGRRVDAITGATGTSRAVERFLNANIARFLRAARKANLAGPGAGEAER